MQLNPVKGTAPSGDVEFLLSAHRTTKAVTLDETYVRSGQYETGRKIVKSGTVLGKVTATGLHAPVKKTTLAAAAASTDTTIQVEDARFLQAGDVLDVNGTQVTVDSVNYDTNVVTLTGQIGAAKNQGDTVKATNGLGDADCILWGTVDLTTAELTFQDGAGSAVTHGVVRESRLKGINSLTKADLTRIEFR